jgi:hypothetical protein
MEPAILDSKYLIVLMVVPCTICRRWCKVWL